jgi:hypothetical protein
MFRALVKRPGLASTTIALAAQANQSAKAEEKNDSIPFKPIYESFEQVHAQSCKKFYEDLKSKPWYEAVTKKYIAQFEQESKEILAEYCKILGATQEQIDYFKVTAFPSYEHQRQKWALTLKMNSAPVPGSLLKKIEYMLNKFFIDLKGITIVRNVGLNSEFGVCEYSFQVGILPCCKYDFINTKFECNFSLTDEALEAVLIHEVQHILHNDNYKLIALKWYSGTINKSYDKQALDKLFERYSKFHERRADIITGLADIKYCKGLIDFFHEMQRRDYSESAENSTHEVTPVRTTYMKKLLLEIEETTLNKKR